MTTYKEVRDYKSTEFYNVAPAEYFSLYDIQTKTHCLCFKVTINSYFNLETEEYIELDEDDLDMMIDIVKASVEWSHVTEA